MNDQAIEQGLKALKISSLNEMQKAAVEANNKGNDIILLSPTGSGKTVAFLIPVLKMIHSDTPSVDSLIIAPSRELALQIEKVARTLATGYKIVCCYGGHPFSVERNSLSPAPRIVIGTPGRIADHLRRETIDGSTVRSLILDEFDKALEFGFKEDMVYIISQLSNLEKRILTSATDLPEIPEFTGIQRPIVLNYLSERRSEALAFKYISAAPTEKPESLFKLICKIGNRSTIVFCNHREAVERISTLLKDNRIEHGVFHGGMEQEDRERALIKFRNGSQKLLITTDLASRGLDIPEVEFIIHYQLPPTPEVFTHRNGRTARMHAKGTAYLVITDDEYIPRFIEDKPELDPLQGEYQLPPKPEWQTLFIGAGKKDKVNKVDIVGFLIQKGNLDKSELGLIEVKDFTSYVAVKRDKVRTTIKSLENERIKNKKVRVEISQ